MKFHHRWAVSAISAATLFCVSAGASASTLDQYSFTELTPSDGAGIAYISDTFGSFRRAQTFTVGLNGYLDSVLVEFNGAVSGWPDGSIQEMRILGTTPSGAPTDTVLASVSSYTLNNVFGTFNFSSSNLYLSAGSVLAFEIIGDGAVQTNNSTDISSPYYPSYQDGSDYYINHPYGIHNWTQNAGNDLRFQTYMNPVPLPATAWLFASGLLGLIKVAKLKLKGARPN